MVMKPHPFQSKAKLAWLKLATRLFCCQAISSPIELWCLLSDVAGDTPGHLSKLQHISLAYLAKLIGTAEFCVDSSSLRSWMLSHVFLPNWSMWVNVLSTPWMACMVPMGKSHIVWHFTAETVNGRVKCRRTKRMESCTVQYLFILSRHPKRVVSMAR